MVRPLLRPGSTLREFTPETGDEAAEFFRLRFWGREDATLAVAAIQSVLDCPLGAAFREGSLRAMILRHSMESDPVLMFSRGARAAARLAGLRLPRSEGAVRVDPGEYVSVLAPAAPSSQTDRPGTPEKGPLRVLIVEDHVDTAMMLADLLTAWGFEAAIARTGAEALEVATELRPRVVLLDLGLPDQHGYGVAKRMREELGRDQMSFIVVTGWSQIVDQSLSARAGISHHLVKPVNPDALRSILDSIAA